MLTTQIISTAFLLITTTFACTEVMAEPLLAQVSPGGTIPALAPVSVVSVESVFPDSPETDLANNSMASAQVSAPAPTGGDLYVTKSKEPYYDSSDHKIEYAMQGIGVLAAFTFAIYGIFLLGKAAVVKGDRSYTAYLGVIMLFLAVAVPITFHIIGPTPSVAGCGM